MQKKSSPLRYLLYVSLLGLFGVLLSLYLVYDHIKDDESSFCDVGSHISCSKVRRSVFSEFLGVPVALFGVLFNSVIAIGALLAIKTDTSTSHLYISALFYWNIAGAASVFYLVFAEIYLQVMCPFCTVVHLCQVVVLYLMWVVYDSTKNPPSLMETIWGLKEWVIALFFIGALMFVVANASFEFKETVGNEAPITNESFSRCITKSGWKFYGLKGCSWCEKQKLLFGKTFSRINFVDCGESRETCQGLGIDGYPTWIRFSEDGKELDRWKGYASVETWQVLTTCKDPYNH